MMIFVEFTSCTNERDAIQQVRGACAHSETSMCTQCDRHVFVKKVNGRSFGLLGDKYLLWVVGVEIEHFLKMRGEPKNVLWW